MKKYYTPTPDEFCVGFIYEWHNGDGAWEEAIIQSMDYPLIDRCDGGEYPFEYALSDGRIRVKELDKSDIEDLGWNYSSWSGVDTNSNELIFTHGRYNLFFIDGRISITDNNKSRSCNGMFFHGHILDGCLIKNKFELIKMVKKLSIF